AYAIDRAVPDVRRSRQDHGEGRHHCGSQSCGKLHHLPGNGWLLSYRAAGERGTYPALGCPSEHGWTSVGNIEAELRESASASSSKEFARVECSDYNGTADRLAAAVS